ncbi:hypothetical protein JCM19297_3025 [Nonlabens ulvanivorans]|nr:hypothetical protein [Nonlabens ulvanivorans]GAK88512.1 hypothetical protein JCM19297_3025 [Nonlabens ulvanivorans]
MEIIKHAHSGWAYIVVIVLGLATINSLIGYFTKKEFGNRDFSLALGGLIVTHIQLLIGMVLYFTSPWFDAWSGGMKEVMGNPEARLMLVEHPLTMIIAITLLTMGYSKHKKKIVSNGKLKVLAIFYSLAFILVLTRLPWSQWL